MSPQDPFCYQLIGARDHLSHIINLCNVAMSMPAFKTWEHKHQRLLKGTRTQCTRQRTILNNLIPLAVDASYYKKPLLTDEEERAEVQQALDRSLAANTSPAPDSEPG